METVKQAAIQQFPTLAKGPTSTTKSPTVVSESLEKTFQQCMAIGYSIQAASDFLKHKGYPEDQIQQVIAKNKKPA